MKSILYIYHTSLIGGGSYCLLNILKALERSQIRPYVLLKENGPLVDEIKKLDIQVFFMKELSTVPYNTSTLTIKNIKNAFRIIFSFSKYKKILKNIKPDIVYVNTMMLYPYLRQAKKLGLKTIIHVREHWPEGEHIFQRNIALNHIDKYADYIVAINTYSSSMLSFSEKPKKIVYDWIDLSSRFEERFYSEIFGQSVAGLKVYLYMGGMQPIKGTLEIVSTFSNVIKDSDARLLIMGINPKVYNLGLKGRVKRILSKIGFPSYTEKVLNIINSDDRIKCIPNTYKINHIIQQAYCILSYFTVPHANLALAESIILGTPTIAADTSESREYSLDGKLASLFNINDIKDFEDKIVHFDRERDQIIYNIEQNANQIEKIFDPKANENKLNEIYKTL